MRNIWIICRRELNSYFSSPIAWLLLTMYSVIFGFIFWNFLAEFVKQAMEMEMMGQTQPMNINEQIIRPLLGTSSFLGLFFIPLISMRLFAEEKRNGTIELLATSPVRDIEIILGKWFAATAALLLDHPLRRHQLRLPLPFRQSGLEADADHPARRLPPGSGAAGHRHLYLHPDQKSDHRRRAHFRRLPLAMGLLLGQQL